MTLMDYQHVQVPTFPNSKSLIQTQSQTSIKPHVKSTCVRNHITISHRMLSFCLLTCPRCSKGPQVATQWFPKRPQAPAESPPKPERKIKSIRKYKHNVKTCKTKMKYRINLLTCTQGAWSEVQSQRSQRIQNRIGGPLEGLQLCCWIPS